jgi:hypothetical protein
MSEISPKASSSKHPLTLAASCTLPLLVNSFRNKLIGAVLIGMVVTQTAWAADHGHSRGQQRQRAAADVVTFDPGPANYASVIVERR